MAGQILGGHQYAEAGGPEDCSTLSGDNIAHHCISLYHRVVATRLQDIIEEGLEGQEYASLLQWVLNNYTGPELMGSTALGLEKNLIPSLLTDAAVGRLTRCYLVHDRHHQQLKQV